LGLVLIRRGLMFHSHKKIENIFVCDNTSKFVLAEAQEKLEHAEELALGLNEMDTSIKHEAEIAEKQRQEMSENRMNLARERVNLLKARSREEGLRGSDINSALVCCSSSRSYNELGLMQPYVRRALVSLKNDLNKLRQE